MIDTLNAREEPETSQSLSRNLLDDYATIAKKRKNAVEATALRNESVQYREIIAHLASHGEQTLDEVIDTVNFSKKNNYDSKNLAILGKVCLLQKFNDSDESFGYKALSDGIDGMQKNLSSRPYRRLQLEYLISKNRDIEAHELLTKYPDLKREYYNYLEGELWHPERLGPFANLDQWLTSFNAPLLSHGLEPIELLNGEQSAFDRMRSNTSSVDIKNQPPITIIVTTYKPSYDELFNSITSLLNQTWKNLEIIIVDDCSPEDYSSDLLAVSQLDERVRLISSQVNMGTYVSRNIGMSEAQGEFITGQDDDDWSHPRRLEYQIRFLLEHPEVPGCRVKAIACSPDLERVRIGYKPETPNASSLMIRKQFVGLSGGFLPARKAADTEFQKRIEKIAGVDVAELAEPLTLIRILPDSLSRSEFRAGWSHPARRQFKSSYSYWHQNSSPKELCITDSSHVNTKIPLRFQLTKVAATLDLDVVFAGDWRQYGGPQKSMIEEIHALTTAGMKVGILHLEAPRFMSSSTKYVCDPIQKLINSGTVLDVLYDDPINVNILVLRYPPILQFSTSLPSNLRIQRMIILANQAPSERDGSDIRYDVQRCSTNARRMFGVIASWVPQGPSVRKAIMDQTAPGELAAYDMPGILDLNEWRTYRTGFRSTVPVIGRHSRDNAMKWPESRKVLEQVYRVDGSHDVRVMGGASVPLEILELKSPPPSWIVYQTNEIPVRRFLQSLDFFVFFQNTNAIEAFGRAVLEAIAAGVVAILPWHYEEVFGSAAVYSTVDKVSETIALFYSDWDKYEKQINTANQIVENEFSYSSYVQRVASLL